MEKLEITDIYKDMDLSEDEAVEHCTDLLNYAALGYLSGLSDTPLTKALKIKTRRGVKELTDLIDSSQDIYTGVNEIVFCALRYPMGEVVVANADWISTILFSFDLNTNKTLSEIDMGCRATQRVLDRVLETYVARLSH